MGPSVANKSAAANMSIWRGIALRLNGAHQLDSRSRVGCAIIPRLRSSAERTSRGYPTTEDRGARLNRE